MWHYISKNFGKPHIIPSKEGVTTYNTPNAVKIHFGDDFKKCFEEDQYGRDTYKDEKYFPRVEE